MIKMHKDSSWAAAKDLLRGIRQSWSSAVRKATLQEAYLLRALIVDGITKQAPGDEAALKPLSILTLAARRLKGFKGSKALIKRADLRNSIATVAGSDAVFVGVLRRARASDGRSLMDLATIHEFGTAPAIVPITPKMRRFLGALFAEGHLGGQRATSQGRGYVVVQIPARSFLRPSARKFQKGMRERLSRRLASLLQGMGPKP